MSNKYVVLFAPDGKHFQIIEKGNIEKCWEYINSPDVVINKALNQFAKFRLINSKTNKIIGEK